jgi:hypothetical protein
MPGFDYAKRDELSEIRLHEGCFEKGRLKRRVAVALIWEFVQHLPVPVVLNEKDEVVRDIHWGQVIADAACYGSRRDVASAAYEGRKVMTSGK